MEQTEWVVRCAARLREQWRRASQDDLLEAAQDLYRQPKWQRFGPEVAAVAWLRLGGLGERPLREAQRGTAGSCPAV